MKVGESSTELAEWFQINDDQAAYITAWNHFGEKIPDNENYVAEQKLISEIESRELFYLKGKSIDPTGLWPNEPSLLIFGMCRGGSFCSDESPFYFF